jgi:hypothetical protein
VKQIADGRGVLLRWGRRLEGGLGIHERVEEAADDDRKMEQEKRCWMVDASRWMKKKNQSRETGKSED